MSTLTEVESAIDRLSLSEKEELLSRLAVKLGGAGSEEFPVREDHVQLLEQRFSAYRDDPRQASTWEDVKRRFEAQRD